jgi:hypothetical protein
MRWIKWTAIALVVAAVGGFLHWSLPSYDVVRIVGTDVKRLDVEVTEGGETRTRSEDMRLINAIAPDGSPRVFRNQDTGWGWPPYFKFDSGNLSAKAEDSVSTEKDPEWFVVTHYGWRVTFLSQYPNAVSLRPAEGPDETIVPWVNIVILAVLAALFLFVRRRVLSLFGA